MSSLKRVHGMSHVFPLFCFRLNRGQGIGPLVLRRIWADACGTNDVTVSRAARGNIGTDYLYSLCGPQRIEHIHLVEARLRELLAVSLPNATIDLTRI